jgi:SPOR domain
VALAPRTLSEIGTRCRRHHRPKLGLILGAALAGWATIVPVSTPHWPLLIASLAVPVPQSAGGAPSADSVVVPVPMAAPAAAADPDPGVAATTSGGSPSPTPRARVAITTAAEMPAPGPSLPSAAGLEVATEPPKPLLDDRVRPRAEAPPARSQRSPSFAVARATRRGSERPHQIVVQLSSYADEARARHAAETLHRSLHKILKGAAVRTEAGEVHGRRIWRVVAGPIADRERGKRLCDAVRHAGQSCLVTLL